MRGNLSSQSILSLVEETETTLSLQHVPTITRHGLIEQIVRLWPAVLSDIRKLAGARKRRAYEYVLRTTFAHVAADSADEERLLSSLSALMQRQPTATLTFFVELFSHGCSYTIRCAKVHRFILLLFLDALLDDKPKVSIEKVRAAVINCKDSATCIVEVIAGDAQLHKKPTPVRHDLETLLGVLSRYGGSQLTGITATTLDKAVGTIKAKLPDKLQITLLLLICLLDGMDSSHEELRNTILQHVEAPLASLICQSHNATSSSTSGTIQQSAAMTAEYFEAQLAAIAATHTKQPTETLCTILTMVRNMCSMPSCTLESLDQFSSCLLRAFSLLMNGSAPYPAYTPLNGLFLPILATIFNSSIYRQRQIELWGLVLYNGLMAGIIGGIDGASLLHASFCAIGTLPANQGKLFVSLAYIHSMVHTHIVRGGIWPSKTKVSVTDFSVCTGLLYKVACSDCGRDFLARVRPLMDVSSYLAFTESLCRSISEDIHLQQLLSLTDEDRSILEAPAGTVSALHTPNLIPPEKPKLSPDDLKGEQQYKSQLKKYNEEVEKVAAAEDNRRKELLSLINSIEKSLLLYMNTCTAIPSNYVAVVLMHFTTLAFRLSRALSGLPSFSSPSFVRIVIILLNYGLSMCSRVGSRAPVALTSEGSEHNAAQVSVNISLTPCHIANPALLFVLTMLLIKPLKEKAGQEHYSLIASVISTPSVVSSLTAQQIFQQRAAHTGCLLHHLLAPDGFQSWALISSIAVYGLLRSASSDIGSYFMLGAALPLFNLFFNVDDRAVTSPSAKQNIFEYIHTVVQNTPHIIQQSMSRTYYKEFLHWLLILLEYSESARFRHLILGAFCKNIPQSHIDATILSPLLANMVHPTQKSNRHVAIDGLTMLSLPSKDATDSLPLIDTPLLYCQFLIAREEFPSDALERFIVSHTSSTLLSQFSTDVLRELFHYCLETAQADYALSFLPNVVETILDKSLTHEPNIVYLAFILTMNGIVRSYPVIEDLHIDKGTRAATQRRYLWATMVMVIRALAVHDVPIIQCHQLVRDMGCDECIVTGTLSILASHTFPIACNIMLQDQAAECTRRREKLYSEYLFLPDGAKEYRANGNLVVVPNFFSQNVIIDCLRATPHIFICRNPLELTCLEMIVEFALLVGLIDFDSPSLQSCIDCVSSIFQVFGSKYQKQLLFIKSSVRMECMDSLVISQIVLKLMKRILAYGDLQLANGTFYQHIIHQDMLLTEINTRTLSSILMILSNVCAWLPWKHPLRDDLLAFLMKLISIRDTTEGQVLYQTIVQNVPVMFPQESAEALDYINNVMIKQFGDLVTQHMHTYPGPCPGAPFALAGAATYSGLSCLIQEPSVLSQYVLPLLEPANNISRLQNEDNADVCKVMNGLTVVEGLYVGFKKLFEPCLNTVISHIMRLSGSSNKMIVEKLSRMYGSILENISPFGIHYALPKLLQALNLGADWNERHGALSLMYRIYTIDNRIISHFLMKSIIFSMLPQVIPAVLEIIVAESNFKVKQLAQKTMDVISLSVQSTDIRAHVPNMLKAFSDPSLLRSILCDISEIVFSTRIDGASLTLLVPLCQKALSLPTSTVYKVGADRLGDTHTKVIACQCLALCCRIGVLADLKGHIVLIKRSLKATLMETNPDIRSAGAKALATLCMVVTNEADAILNEIWADIFFKQNLHYAEANGLAEAISTILVDLNRTDELYENLRLFYYFRCGWSFTGVAPNIQSELQEHFVKRYQTANALTFLLILKYMSKRIAELKDAAQESNFIATFFREAFSMIFIPITSSTHDIGYFLETRTQIARILATSFLNSDGYQISTILRTLQQYAFTESSATRALCASLTGDIISDLGSETVSLPTAAEVSSEPAKSKKPKVQLNEAYYSLSERSEKSKVFIPESAIKQAVARLGQENFNVLMSIIFLLRLDPVTEVRTQAMTTWKAIVQKPLEMMRECLSHIQQLLLTMSKLVDPAEAPDDSTFSYQTLIHLTIHDLMRMSATHTSEFMYPPLMDIVMLSEPSLDNPEPDAAGALYILSIMVKQAQQQQYQLPPLLLSTEMVQKVSLYLTSSDALASHSATNLLSSLSTNKEDTLDVTGVIVNPLIKEILETPSAPDRKIDTLASLCRQKMNTMETVLTHLLEMLAEDPLGNSDRNQTIGRVITKILLPGPKGLVHVAKMVFERVCECIAACPDEAFDDADTSTKLRTYPIGCALDASINAVLVDKSMSIMVTKYCMDSFKSQAYGQVVAAFVILQILLDINSPNSYYQIVIHDTDFIYEALQLLCWAMSRKNLAGNITVIIGTFHNLNKALGGCNVEFLTAFVYGMYSTLRTSLVLNSGFLSVVSQSDLSILIEILMSVFSSKVVTHLSVQSAAITAALFLLYTAGSAPLDRKQSDGIREVVLDDVTFLVDPTAGKAMKPYITRSVGRVLNILNDQLAPEVRVKLLDMLAVILQLSPENCRMFEGSIRVTVFTKKGLLSPNKETRTSASSLIILLAKISAKPEQLAYLLLSTAVMHNPATNQVVISSESASVNTSVLLCLSDLLQTVTLNPAAVLNKVAALPLIQPLLPSIITNIHHCYVLSSTTMYKVPAANCIALAMLQLPVREAIEHVVNIIFAKSINNIEGREQNRIANRLIGAAISRQAPSSIAESQTCPSGIELFLLAYEVHQKLVSETKSIDSWFQQRMDSVSEAADYLVLLELYLTVFTTAGSFGTKYSGSAPSPLSSLISGLLAPIVTLIETVLKALVDPTQNLPVESKLETVRVIESCISSGNLSGVHRKLLATYIAVEVKILICDKNQHVMTAAENLFINLFNLQYGMDFATSILNSIAKNQRDFSKELQDYAEMLVRRIHAH